MDKGPHFLLSYQTGNQNKPIHLRVLSGQQRGGGKKAKETELINIKVANTTIIIHVFRRNPSLINVSLLVKIKLSPSKTVATCLVTYCNLPCLLMTYCVLEPNVVNVTLNIDGLPFLN